MRIFCFFGGLFEAFEGQNMEGDVRKQGLHWRVYVFFPQMGGEVCGFASRACAR